MVISMPGIFINPGDGGPNFKWRRWHHGCQQAHAGVCLWLPYEGRVPHISLVFREMWDTINVDRSVHGTNPESEGRCSGIPHLAKNERDVGHPAFVREPEANPARQPLCAQEG